MPNLTAADALVRRLRDHGVRHVFGYPGGQLTPVYDALTREPTIRHVLARDEQAAAFMADGYARATGQPGVCLAVCGPGVFNAATPLANAFTDSIPVLLISGQVPTEGRGLRTGYYHENDQVAACASLTRAQFRVGDAAVLLPTLDRAMHELTQQRPGPVLLEVPIDVQRAACPRDVPMSTRKQPAAALNEIDLLAALIRQWRRPLLMVGGGVISARAESLVVALAERLGAPVFTSFMGKTAIPWDHPLAAGLPWHRATSDMSDMQQYISPLFAQADGLLAIGCRFSQVSTGSWQLPARSALAQIDIDPEELGRHYPVVRAVCGDAHQALQQLLTSLSEPSRKPWTTARTAREPWRLPGWDLIGPMRRALPHESIVVADVTRLAYIMLAEFPTYQPRTFLHPAGFVAMGYAIPAALGAKAALPDRPVVAVVGDGGFLMSGMELATAVQENLPIVIVLINDRCLTLIKAIQERRYEGRFLGVDLHNPDFQTFAQSFGVRSWSVENDAAFEVALREALALGAPALVEVRLN
jgi:acetolactate synthase-1/2/3 large subunit